MVFEDITKRNYEMKYTQLDLDEAKIVYAKLARWHATSMYLSDKVRLQLKLVVQKHPTYSDILQRYQSFRSWSIASEN